MRMMTLAVAAVLVLVLSACERRGGNPPKPVTSALPAAVILG